LQAPAYEASPDFPFRTRDDFLSAAELSFYRVLMLAIEDRAVIFAKVGLGDIFFVSNTKNSVAHRNRIDRKHVDFLACDQTTLHPLFGIELDDKSHSRQDRSERDALVDQVFQAAGLPLVHIAARGAYQPNQLKTQLAQYLDVQEPGATIEPQVVGTQSPLCPKCGQPMVIRVASKGSNAGKKFWGCSNYPRCKELIQM
jgi:hypothetical protein